MIISSLCVGIIDTQMHTENFPKYRSVGQSRFTQQAIVVNTCESDHF